MTDEQSPGAPPWLDVRGTPYPPYVLGEEKRRRWDQATLIAIATAAQFEEDGQFDTTFVWHAARSIYQDPKVEPWSEAELAEAEAGAVGAGVIEPRQRDREG